jgi:hypothetical protein
MRARTRLIASAALGGTYLIVRSTLAPDALVAAGENAAGQLENSDAAAVASSIQGEVYSLLGAPALALLLIGLVVIWKKPLLRLLNGGAAVSVIAALAAAGFAADAAAYYDKTDYTEAYFITPNQSAFYIPDVGANKDSQGRFDSAEYYSANKVAAKRFTVPHAKFSGSGMFTDYYVPAGRLIIVDRSPYSREWTASHDRGSSAKNESFLCQSKEGLNVTTEVGIAASVTEENAAKFLYNFGVKDPAGERSDPKVIFQSVFYGRSLAEVMDGVVRGKVGSLVCREIGARSFDDVNSDVNKILTEVEKGTGEFLATRGITLNYIGWAGTFSFDKDIQQAINDRYAAQKIAPVIETLKTKALIDTMQKWNGVAPSTVATGGDAAGALFGILKSGVVPSRDEEQKTSGPVKR